ncbi:hypothetical protein SUGI_1191690 [Cryptomeria japonica]|uniref:NDR1/HIN1-like protein 10 n=1 Tax=Cryptomeria japonica TaxID=3369 RepID=UPI002414BA99|nr:NDR1/HIN1-like protein 10 [Cryptomeria japonica]GLJ55497.1 hypothetical protein SUGI_1191690 [Cryptomeria japonica]
MGEGAKPGPTFNGGYYSAGGNGAPIPSPTAAYILPKRRRGMPCFLKFLINFIIGLVILIGVAALVIWLVVRPTKPKFYVDDVNFSNNSTIALNMTVRNGNRRMGIYYDTIYAFAIPFSAEQSIAATGLHEFYQGHKNTTILRPVFLSAASSSSSNTGDVVDMEVKLRSRVRFKVGGFKSRHYKLKVKCRFSAPLNETTATTFQRKKCKVDVDR